MIEFFFSPSTLCPACLGAWPVSCFCFIHTSGRHQRPNFELNPFFSLIKWSITTYDLDGLTSVIENGQHYQQQSYISKNSLIVCN